MRGKGLTNNNFYVHTFSYTLRYLDRKDDNRRTFMNPEHKTVCTFWIFILKFKGKKTIQETVMILLISIWRILNKPDKQQIEQKQEDGKIIMYV